MLGLPPLTLCAQEAGSPGRLIRPSFTPPPAGQALVQPSGHSNMKPTTRGSAHPHGKGRSRTGPRNAAQATCRPAGPWGRTPAARSGGGLRFGEGHRVCCLTGATRHPQLQLRRPPKPCVSTPSGSPVPDTPLGHRPALPLPGTGLPAPCPVSQCWSALPAHAFHSPGSI